MSAERHGDPSGRDDRPGAAPPPAPPVRPEEIRPDDHWERVARPSRLLPVAVGAGLGASLDVLTAVLAAPLVGWLIQRRRRRHH